MSLRGGVNGGHGSTVAEDGGSEGGGGLGLHAGEDVLVDAHGE